MRRRRKEKEEEEKEKEEEEEEEEDLSVKRTTVINSQVVQWHNGIIVCS